MGQITVFWKDANIVYWTTPMVASKLNSRENCKPIPAEGLQALDPGHIDSMMVGDGNNANALGQQSINDLRIGHGLVVVVV